MVEQGIVPTPSFASENLERVIYRSRPHELRTARRLNRIGISTDLQEDVRHYKDAETGLDQRVGLADFKNGYEIKTLNGASEESTIDSYLRKVSKKEGVVAAVFDNTENDSMEDEDLIASIMRSRRFSGRVYVLMRSGKYQRIK